ncbi:MAG: hypothetical protein AABX29_05505 [Nanoarchaeota archaeon]
MGILGRIKEFFQLDLENKQEKPKEQKEIGIEDIEFFLSRREEEIEKSLKGKNKELHYEISPIIVKLENDMEMLSKVNLSSKRENEKIMNMNELGRRDYLDSLNKLTISLKNKENNIEQLSDELEKFINNSSKSYAKVTLLIGREVENIVKDISSIRKILDNFKKSNSYLLEKNRKIIKLISIHEEKINNEKIKSNTLEEIEKIKRISGIDEEGLDEINNKIKSIKNSEDYKKREWLIRNKDKEEEKLKSLKSKIGLIIDSRVLKKYAYMEDNYNKKIVGEYLENAAEKLMSDENLEIMDVLANAKEKIKDGKLEVKEPDKVIERLSIPIEVFIEYRNDILKSIDEIKKNDDKIKQIGYNLKVDELIKNKTKIENKILENESNLAVLHKKLNKIERTIDDLENELVIEVSEL